MKTIVKLAVALALVAGFCSPSRRGRNGDGQADVRQVRAQEAGQTSLRTYSSRTDAAGKATEYYVAEERRREGLTATPARARSPRR